MIRSPDKSNKVELDRRRYVNWASLIPVIQLLSHEIGTAKTLELTENDHKLSTLRRFARQLDFSSLRNPYVLYAQRNAVTVAKQLTDLFGRDGSGLAANLMDGPVWIDIRRPTPSDCRILVRSFGLHPVLVEDLLSPAPPLAEGCGFVNDQFLLRFESVPPLFLYERRNTGQATAEISPDAHGTTVTCVISPAVLFTLHNAPVPTLTPVLTKLCGALYPFEKCFYSRGDGTPLARNPLFSVLLLLEEQFNLVLQTVASLNRRIAAIDELVFARQDTQTRESSESFLCEISALRTLTLSVQRYLSKKKELLKSVVKKCEVTQSCRLVDVRQSHSVQELFAYSLAEGVTSDTGISWLGYLWSPVAPSYLHLASRIDNELASLEQASDLLNRNFAAYMALLTYDLTTSSKRINDVLSHITKFTTIAGPLACATSLCGMNVTIPFQSALNFYPFYVVVCVLSLAAYFAYAVGASKR